MIKELQIADYYNQATLPTLIDVRSPGEFAKGHIPGAHNIPLFNNEERARVGTIYVQKSKEKAIALGYEIVTPKLDDFIKRSQSIHSKGPIVIHCWRGGMRSKSFANHLFENGFNEVYYIEGGYKAFRNHALNFFKQNFPLRIVGGYTGSGKTQILHQLAQKGEQVVDLEGIAHHKGSAFGSVGEKAQPSYEQFENNLFQRMRTLRFDRPIWVEDESHNIGKVQIPLPLYHQIREQQLYFLSIPKEQRVALLVKEYGDFGLEPLQKGMETITKRLGGLATQQALDHLKNNELQEAASLALNYYDKAYLRGLSDRGENNVVTIDCPKIDPKQNADTLLLEVKKHEQNKINAL